MPRYVAATIPRLFSADNPKILANNKSTRGSVLCPWATFIRRLGFGSVMTQRVRNYRDWLNSLLIASVLLIQRVDGYHPLGTARRERDIP